MATHDSLLNDPSAAPPAALLDQWRTFVEGCERGYEYNVLEYHTDLDARDRIQRCLDDPACGGAEFAAAVEALDARFRALLQPGVQVGPEGDPWWHRGVPQYAGDSLSAGMSEWFGVEVQVRE